MASFTSVIANEIQRLINLWPSLSGPTSFDVCDARLMSVCIDPTGRTADELGAEKVGAILFLQSRKMVYDRYYSSPYVNGSYHPLAQYLEYHRKQWTLGVEQVRKVILGGYTAILRNRWVAEQVIEDIRHANLSAVFITVNTREYSPYEDVFKALNSLVILSPQNADDEILRRFDGSCKRPGEFGGGLNVLMVKSGWDGSTMRQHLILPSSPPI